MNQKDHYKSPYNSFDEVAQRAMTGFYRACLDATRDEMKKREVTDEMVTTALKIYEAYAPCVTKKSDAMHHALEAALNLHEPEVVVTEEMIRAGQTARDCSYGWEVTDIYRAMRRLEPYDPLAKQGQMQSRRKNDGGGSGSGNCDR